jgi:hypothetical protein
MKLADVEGATTEELRATVDRLIDQAWNTNIIPHRELRLSEARFYLAELERRRYEEDRQEDERNSNRDYRLELIIIALIIFEIVIGIGEIVVGIYEGKEQANLLGSQARILQNLQTTTKSTADSLSEQLAIQYRVFVNLQPNGRNLALFNNSKSEVTFWGIKIGKRPAELNRDRFSAIPALSMAMILVEQFYPTLYSNLPERGSVLPVVIYLKGADNREYVVEGNLIFSKQGVSGRSLLRAEKWSDQVIFLQTPPGNLKPS